MKKIEVSMSLANICAAILIATMAYHAALASSDTLFERQKITVDRPQDIAFSFGNTVSADGNRALIAASGSSAGDSVGYIFGDDGSGHWNQVARLTLTETTPNQLFGRTVALDGSSALVGGYVLAAGGKQSGTALIYHDVGSGNWQPVGKLMPNDPSLDDGFGTALAISGNTAIVGAPTHDDGGTDAGSAYVFRADRLGNWQQVAKLDADIPVARANFGYSVALDGNLALVGSPNRVENGGPIGAAYLFKEDNAGQWKQLAKIPNFRAPDSFGWSVALDGSTALISDPSEELAYIYQDDGTGSWTRMATLTGDNRFSSGFGKVVALDGDLALVGAYQENKEFGDAYVFREVAPDQWERIAKLVASDAGLEDYPGGGQEDWLGWSVALSGHQALVGALLDGAATHDGSVYVFRVPEPSGIFLALCGGLMFLGSPWSRMRSETALAP